MSKITPSKQFFANNLDVKVYETRSVMGAAAARDVADHIRSLQASRRSHVNIILAAAPSQNEFLENLTLEPGIDWARVNGFHMDEYAGIDQSADQSFATFLRTKIFYKIPPAQVHYINGTAIDISGECNRYTDLLQKFPVDVVCMGVGENTHIAFNDPHAANFNDPVLVKVVELDDASRQQQVHDGCFPTLDAVPVKAITLTVPALLNGKAIFCMVPGKNKALAIQRTIYADVSEKYPSTSLRNHPGAKLYLDKDSAQELE